MILFRLFLIASLGALSSAPVVAQIVFSASDLPGAIGYHSRAYVNTLYVDLGRGGVGGPGGPWFWDVSEPPYPDEIVKRLDVVGTADGGHGTNWPAATFAQRLTNESNGARDWSYYQITTNQGRIYYGFYDSNSNPDVPAKVFRPPTLDIPASVQYGQIWSRSLDFNDFGSSFPFYVDYAVHFTAQAEVDAFGTLVLPGIGAVPALRVNETLTYEYTDLTYGFLDRTDCFREYYWLVRGIGKALDIISEADYSVPPADFTTASIFLRVFEFSSRPAPDLRVRLLGNTATLDWRPQTNCSGYRVQMLPAFASNNWQISSNWQILAEPATNSWAQAVPPGDTQRFFRVSLKP